MMNEIKKGKIYQGVVEKMVYGGKGLIRLNDFVILVDKVLTGQEIEFQIIKLKKNYAEGKLIQVFKKASNEIEAECHHFGQCGGCKWQNLEYTEQLKIKEGIVKENIETVYTIDYAFEPIVPSPEVWHYRNKLDFSYGYQEMRVETNLAGERIYHDLNPALGFHKPKKFELILAIQHCAIAFPEANQVLGAMEKFREENNLSVHNPKTHRGLMRNVIVRKGKKTGEVLVQIIVNQEDFDQVRITSNLEKLVGKLTQVKGIVGILLIQNKSWNDAVIDGHTEVLWGRDYLYDQIEALKFKISPESFFQTNTLGAEKLYKTAKEFADLKGFEVVLDLYCGTGTIGLFMADQAKKVYGIEIVESAIANAKVNAELNQIQNAEFICGNIDKSLHDLLHKVDSQIDVVILDPPRVGVGAKALQRVFEISAKKIVYVSCNPTTFARDLEILMQNGYQLKRVRPVDMFPHTHHVELVAEIVK